MGNNNILFVAVGHGYEPKHFGHQKLLPNNFPIFAQPYYLLKLLVMGSWTYAFVIPQGKSTNEQLRTSPYG